MLSIIFMVVFMMPLSLVMNQWYMVQNMMFLMTFMYLLSVPSDLSMVGFTFGVDLLSFGLILLSFWISSLMLMSSRLVLEGVLGKGMFLLLVILLLLLLILSFSSLSLFNFYLFFEGSLIPIFLLVLGWGYQPERLQAGIYMLFYTLLASLPLLVSIFMLEYKNCSFMFGLADLCYLNNFFIYIGMVMAFLVSMPMFMVHLWLPSAHVEAPVSGSMILAGVLLKLGGYGLMRVLPLVMGISIKVSVLWMVVSLLGGLIVSLICMCQYDMKSLVAYSSVVHMGVVICGIMTLSMWGLSGSYTMMVAHGLCSSGLFCLVNLGYERLGSRNLLLNKGLINMMPGLSMWWFLLSVCNMSAPPSLNLLGEISLLNSIVAWSTYSMMFLMLISFLSAGYTLYLYSYSQHGSIYSGSYAFNTCSVREYMIVVLHWIPLNLLIMKSDFCILWL